MITDHLAEAERQLDKANAELLIPGALKAEVLLSVSRMLNKLHGLDATVLASFEATREHRAEGHSSPIGFLKHHCRDRGPDAARRRRVARELRSMPVTHDTLRAGLIGVEHVELLAYARKRTSDEAFAIAEQALVDLAMTKRFCAFERKVRYFIIRAAPREAAARERKDREGRWASSSQTFAGNVSVDAWFDVLSGEIWQAELERQMEVLYQQDRAEARDRLGREPHDHELGRTTPQRRLDAMRVMAERSAAYGDDQAPPSPFTTVVHADADLVRRLVEALLDDENGPDDIEALEFGPETLCETDSGIPLTVNTLLLALLSGTVKGYLYDPDGEPLRYGRDRRLFTHGQAQALAARYWRCMHPFGCDHTGRRLRSDHQPEWEDGGLTNVKDGRRLCDPHNTWKHNTKHDPPPHGDCPPDTGQRRLPPGIPDDPEDDDQD